MNIVEFSPQDHYTGQYVGVLSLFLYVCIVTSIMCIVTVGVKKKFPRSIRTTGARLKNPDGERELNGR